MFVLFLNRNLIYPSLMTSAFKVGRKIFVHDLFSHSIIYKTSWHNEYIGIVVLTDKMSYLRNPT